MKTLPVALALVLVSAAPAAAQFAVDGSIGVTAPVGQYGRGLAAGLDLMGAVEWHPLPLVPFAIRGELGWDRIGGAATYVGVEYITRVAFDGVLDIPLPATPIRPYALVGIGAYRLSVAGNGTTDFGYNLGGGVRYRLPFIQPFFEVRYHHMNFPGGVEFVPFQFGVRIPLP